MKQRPSWDGCKWEAGVCPGEKTVVVKEWTKRKDEGEGNIEGRLARQLSVHASGRLGVPGNCTETSLEIFTCMFFLSE